MEIPEDIVAQILVQDIEQRNISKLISKSITEKVLQAEYQEYIEKVVPLPLTQDDILLAIANHLGVTYNILHVSDITNGYRSNFHAYNVETNRETVATREVFTEWEQFQRGNIIPTIIHREYIFTDEDDDISYDVSNHIYILNRKGYVLSSLIVTYGIYYSRLTETDINNKIGQERATVIWERTAATHLTNYYRETVKRLKEYDILLLLLFITTELENISSTLYTIDFEANVEEQIGELKPLLESMWMEKYGFSL